ncbi:MAG: endonuclease III [Chitinophagales bacterium]|nr:MAG: endonuclease III [Chitinophagales bacterium]
MTKAELFQYVLNYFRKTNPAPVTELKYANPYELLVAVILSAQCTDKRVNMVTPALFERFPTPFDLARARFEDVYPLIKSVSYPNSKTRHLIAMAKMLTEQYQGEVPADAKELQKLPGVGRKTAHVITSTLFHQPNLAVDTHVFRVANRIGLTSARNPLQTEKQLIKYIAEKDIPLAHHWLILHGRYVCTARNPKCDKCGLTDVCKYYRSLRKKSEKKSVI